MTVLSRCTACLVTAHDQASGCAVCPEEVAWQCMHREAQQCSAGAAAVRPQLHKGSHGAYGKYTEAPAERQRLLLSAQLSEEYSCLSLFIGRMAGRTDQVMISPSRGRLPSTYPNDSSGQCQMCHRHRGLKRNRAHSVVRSQGCESQQFCS